MYLVVYRLFFQKRDKSLVPAYLGSQGSAFSSAAASTTLAINNWTNDIQIGQLLCIVTATNAATATLSGVADTGGINVYSLEADYVGTSFTLSASYLKVASKILKTDSVTLTYAGTGPSRRSALGLAFAPGYYGMDSSAPGMRDKSVLASGTTQTTWAGTTTGTLVSQPQFGINYAGWKGGVASPVYTDATSGFTAVQGPNSGGTVTNVVTFMSYNLAILSTGAYTDGTSVNTAPAEWAQRHVTFRMRPDIYPPLLPPRAMIIVPSWAGSR